MKYATLNLLALLLLLLPNLAKADHCAGGEISYEWVSDSTYRLFFKFYRDCTGIAAPNTFSLCYKNSCNNQGSSIVMNKVTTLPGGSANGSPIYSGCPGYPNKCASLTATIPGYQEWWYTNVVTLPSRCNFWKFSISTSARNASINLGPANTKSFYVEATLDNLYAQGNSSPFFSVKPIPYVCINQPYTYNNGAVDPNSDSLAFELLQPLLGSSCPANPAPVPFLSGTPSYNITNNPFQTNNSFVLNSVNGQMSFTPVLLGAHTLAIRAKEYRNGHLIGTVIRDVQIQVLNCSSPIPTLSIATATISGGTFNNNRIEGCSGAPLSFCFNVKSPVTSGKLIVSDNHFYATQGSSVTYTNQVTDSVRGCFSWTPGYYDTGLKVLTVTAKDTSCNAPGIAISQTFVLPIYISPITYAKDTGVCFGDSVMLHVVGGSAFSWSVLSGSPVTSLSCVNCNDPYAKPSVTTKYIVISNLSSYCSKNKDTVTVSVATPPAKPVASSNSPLCLGSALNLYGASTTTGITWLWKGPSNFHSTQQNPVIGSSKYTDSGKYILSVLINGCASSDTINVQVFPAAIPPPIVAPVNYCIGDPTSDLTAIGNNLKWYNSATGGTGTNIAPIPSSSVVGIFKWYVSQSSGCESPRDSVIVTILALPAPPLTTDMIYCKGAAATALTATGTGLLWYNNPTGGIGSAAAPVPGTSVIGTTYYYVSQTATGCESIRASLKVEVDDVPTAKLTISPDTVCALKNINFKNTASNPSTTYNSWNLDSGIIVNNMNAEINAYWEYTGSKKIILTAKTGNCFSSDSGYVYIHPGPIASFDIQSDICVGKVVSIIPYKQNAGYYWTIDGNPQNDTGYRSPINVSWNSLGTKRIKLVLNNQYGCSSTYDTAVNVHENPTAKIETSDSTSICKGDVISFRTQQGDYYVYEWSPQIYFLQANAAEVTAKIENNSIIYLQVTNQWGCIASDTDYIRTDACCQVFAPDAFTPNGDGRNDKFHVLKPSGNYTFHTIMITDRWGKILFNTQNIEDKWDGTYKGTPQDPDTYYYYVRYICNGTELEKKGNFVLVR